MPIDLERIGYSSLQEVAYQRIREALSRGTFQPGEPLPTRTLAKALGVSTTPVREALARLVAQNVLVVDNVNGIPYVPAITPELLIEIYELRAMLEGLAAEHAARNITKAELENLDRLWLKLSEKALASEDHERLTEEFQYAIYSAARRPVLLDLIRSVWLRSGLVLSLLSKSKPKDFSIEGQRAKVLSALKRGDAKKAGDIMRAAMHATREMLLSVMQR